MERDRKENYQEKLDHLKRLSDWNKEDCEQFIKLVYKYLDSCGYFESDYNIYRFERPKDWINYRDRDFGSWLIDMALQYNMEQGMEYKCELIEDRYKNYSHKS